MGMEGRTTVAVEVGGLRVHWLSRGEFKSRIQS